MTFPHGQEPVVQRLLPILRYHLSALQGADPHSSYRAYEVAAQIWGEPRGLMIGHRAQAFIAALLQSRSVPVEHVDPLDADRRGGLTGDEALLLELITAMNADRTDEARDALARLTRGRMDAPVVRAGLSLAAVLDPVPGNAYMDCARVSRPRLRAVS